MAQRMDIGLKKVVTPKFRVSFPAIFKPKAFQSQEPKYSLTMLFEKTTDLKDLKRAANNACIEMWGQDKAKWPKKLRTPFRDGNDKADMQGYADTIFVSASCKNPPGLVNQSREPILSERDFYAGCYARAELIAFAYDTAGNTGVGFSLQNIQKMADGKPFSGRKDARDVFDEVEDTSEDAANYASEENTEDASLGF